MEHDEQAPDERDEVLRQMERDARASSDPIAREIAALRSEVAELRGSRTRQLTRSVAISVLLSALVIGATAAAQDLTSFTAGTPARADQINANFLLLKTWLERKVGDVDTACTDASCPVSVRGNLSSTGTVSGASVTSSGTISSSGNLLAGGWITMNGTDFVMGNASGRGDGGSALVHDTGDVLALNYAGQLSGGTRVDSALTVNGALSATSLTVGGTSLRDWIRNYVRTECSVRIGWRDGCDATCGSGPARTSPPIRPDGTCSDTDSEGTTQCVGGYSAFNIDGTADGNDNWYVQITCN
jgi:hypothetical protein